MDSESSVKIVGFSVRNPSRASFISLTKLMTAY
jgi:hypothetical protein